MRKSLIALAVFMMTSGSALAGGILTNTNQSIDFLRNPARDAAIGLDGVYSNPAGVVFMPEGLHLGINWQYAHQTRTITSTNPVFQIFARQDFRGCSQCTFHPIHPDCLQHGALESAGQPVGSWRWW